MLGVIREEPSVPGSITMRLVTYEPGGADKLKIISASLPELHDKEILIKVVAFGVNRVDILQRTGQLPSSSILGLEVSGTVEKVKDEEGKWQIGDKVMALLSEGGYAEYVTVHESLVMPIPSNVSFLHAAAIPENWLTAYQLLHVIGKVQPGELVLIHGGGSGVGVAAIQLAKLAEAKVIITAGSSEKIERCLKLGAIAGYNYKTQPFALEILESFSDQGVDLILDCVGQNFWKENVRVLKMDGRWIVYGLLSGGFVDGDILSTILMKRITLQGTTLKSRPLAYRAELIENFTHAILPKLNCEQLQIVIDSVFPLGKISNAHLRMEENENFGKILVLVRNVDVDEEDSYISYCPLCR